MWKILSFIFLQFILIALAADDTSPLFFKGLEEFSANFISEVAKEYKGKSIITSSLGVAIPLAQLALGASGTSQKELLDSLHFPNEDLIRQNTPSQVQQLTSLKGVTFEVADRIYFQEGYKLNPKYQKDVKDIFQTELQSVDFGKSAEVSEQINRWVANATHGKITDLFQSNAFDSSTVATIVNAVYFKGAWKNQFSKSLSKIQDFFGSDGKNVPISFMSQKHTFLYGEDENLKAQVVELPYEGDEVRMVIYLPKEGTSLEDMIKRLEENEKSGKSVDLKPANVELLLPTFKTSTTIDLKEVLPKVGVSRIFDSSNAGLSGVLEKGSDLFISKAAQKAFIEVNEEGSEAAAATQFFATRKGMLGGQTVSFIANRPFFYKIQAGPLTLFSGTFFGNSD